MPEVTPQEENPQKEELPQPYPHWLVAKFFTLGATIPAASVASYVLLMGGKNATVALGFALWGLAVTGLGYYGYAALCVCAERNAQRPRPPAAQTPIRREPEP